MNRERRMVWITCLLVAGSLGLIAARQGPTTVLSGQFLNNCDIDIRPSLPREAQIYWGEPAAGVHGAQAQIWVTMSDALEAGNWNATETRKMTVGKANLIEWSVDTSVSPPKVLLKIDNNVDPVLQVEAYPGGTYDPLGPLLEPLCEDLRTRPAGGANPHERRRIRVTLRNYGLSVPFTVGDV
jgi:hypothetical protein